MTRMGPEIELLLGLLDEAFDKKAWHGPNLRGSIRGLTAALASFRPAPDRHNIWEVVLHAAYWKYAVRRRLSGDKRDRFPLRGSNWFGSPQQDEKSWRKSVWLLQAEHLLLRNTVAATPASSLGERPGRGRYTRAALIRGAACHDLYHAGQIQLLKRLSEVS